MQPYPKLQELAEGIPYGDLAETWQVPNADEFSEDKKLYDYQTDALKKAARALCLYYGEDNKWRTDEMPAMEDLRKRNFADRYMQRGNSLLENLSVQSGRDSHVFRILSEFIEPEGGVIPYHNLINRMCFWMATGSGKTLVMVKLIEYLHSLKQNGEIPPHDVLILAPGEQLLKQIKQTVNEFNFDSDNKLKINLIHLRDAGRQMQTSIGESTNVYYHDSANISDVQKELLTDYRTYERDGEWYVILDEAHKGGKENSKRQAYYAVMARRGFLFNFSATFTDAEDIFTTVKKYNLEDFVRHGYGKNIYLNKAEYNAFKNRGEEINQAERLRIVLKSLITLAYATMRVEKLREIAKSKIYHLPLMLTLAHRSISAQNELWDFFQVLQHVAKDEIDETVFADAKAELVAEWGGAEFLFESAGGPILDGGGRQAIKNMSVAKLREKIFFSCKTGALEYIHNPKKKAELAFKSKGAEKPFALVCIGDTSNWKKDLLSDDYVETTALGSEGFFERLDENHIRILMGSRKFIESWDTNRPNVINFINIGSRGAKKYVMQSIGRGVRIKPLGDKRRRLSSLVLKGDEEKLKQQIENLVSPVETLFLFATNRADIESVLEGVKAAEDSAFMPLLGFEKAARVESNGEKLPLLVPEYKEVDDDSARPPFAMSVPAQKRFKEWVKATSNSVFAVRDGLGAREILALRETVKNGEKIKNSDAKEHVEHDLASLQARVVSHNAQKTKISDGVKVLDEEHDIVHFRNIRVHAEYAEALGAKVERVKNKIARQEKLLSEKSAAERHELGQFKIEETYQAARGQGVVKFAGVAGHYYFPLILWENEKPHYMQHIISAESEIAFVDKLEEWVENNPKEAGEWTWMFSKIDESIDKVHIPYYDNAARKFFPDFVFWMWRGDEYRVVFVDPKTPVYTASQHKIDGYERLFGDVRNPHKFAHGKQKRVSVRLCMFNDPSGVPEKYKHYWTDDPARIFAG